VFSTHLESGDRAVERSRQVDRLLRYVEQFSGPSVIAGDMNADPDSGELRPLREAFDDAWDRALQRGSARSYSDNPPGRHTRTRRGRLDYILTSPDVRATGCAVPDLRDQSNVNVQVLIGTSDDKGVRPSDHNLVWCTLTMSGDAPMKPSAPASPEPASDPADLPESDPGPPPVIDPGPPVEAPITRPSTARPIEVPVAVEPGEEVAPRFGGYLWPCAWWYAYTDLE
jgi:hypothetical protein